MKLSRQQALAQFQPSTRESGGGFGWDTIDHVPAGKAMHPLRDQIIVEPLDVVWSRHILVQYKERPVRGLVKAVGPGHYPKRYDHSEKHKRSRMWDSKRFRPTTVKPGDVVQFGAFPFQSFWWGDRVHLVLREEDVTGVEEQEPVQAILMQAQQLEHTQELMPLLRKLSWANKVPAQGDSFWASAMWKVEPVEDQERWRAFKSCYTIVDDQSWWVPLQGTFATADEAQSAIAVYLASRRPIYFDAAGERCAA